MTLISVEPLSQKTARRIKEMIRKGVLQKGDRIVEKDFCRTMGISRTPLRESLRLLSSEGLVELIPRRGAFVAEPSWRDIKERFWVMGILEGKCARLCAEKMTDEGLRKLENLFKKLERHAQEGNIEAYMVVNDRYHALIQELGGSKVLGDIIGGLRQQKMLYAYKHLCRPNRLGDSMQEHRALQEAFRQSNGEAAERFMQEHLIRQGRALEDVYADLAAQSRSKAVRTSGDGRKRAV
ncbi:MAG: GntR family transcriptional regulator [Pseudomonadota bacterium]